MPRKKKFESSEFRNIPPSLVPTPEITSLFKQHLLELPIFGTGKNDHIYLRAPEYSQSASVKDHEKLLWRLSLTLGSFFKDVRIDAPSYSDTGTRLASSLSVLSSCKKELVASGIVDEKKF